MNSSGTCRVSALAEITAALATSDRLVDSTLVKVMLAMKLTMGEVSAAAGAVVGAAEMRLLLGRLVGLSDGAGEGNYVGKALNAELGEDD